MAVPTSNVVAGTAWSVQMILALLCLSRVLAGGGNKTRMLA